MQQEPVHINVESYGPGLREYNFTSRKDGSFISGLGRPIGCFAVIGISLTLMGTGIFVWANGKVSEEYVPFRTFGSTFISIGLFIFIISLVLLCEAIVTGRCKVDPDSTRSSREDLRSGFRTPRSAYSPVPSRRMSEETIDEQDSQSLLGSFHMTSARSYQTFPYPIPTVRVENETGQTVLSRSA